MHISPIHFNPTNFKSVLPIKRVIEQLPNGATKEISSSYVIANLTKALIGRINKLGKEAGILKDAIPDFNPYQKAGSTFVGASGDVKRFVLFGEDANKARIYGKCCYGSDKITEGMRQTSIEAEITAPLSKRITNADGDTLSLTLFAKRKGSKYELENIEIVKDTARKLNATNSTKIIADKVDATKELYQPDLFDMPRGMHPSEVDDYIAKKKNKK